MDRDNPDYDEYVNEIQQEVADELQRIYYKYRRVFGWANRPLDYYSRVCSKHANYSALLLPHPVYWMLSLWRLIKKDET